MSKIYVDEILPKDNATVDGSKLSAVPSSAISSVSAGAMPSGSTLQTVFAGNLPASSVSTSSQSYIDTGIQATITPTAANNKVIVMANIHFYIQNTDTATWNAINFILKKTTTSGTEDIYEPHGGATTGYMFGAHTNDAADRFMARIPFTYRDTPGTTGSVTYKVYMASKNGYGIQCDRGYGQSEMTLIEVKA